MTSTHESLLLREQKKYSKKGWMTLREVNYKGYIFDLVALNPETRELHIIEIDLAHETPKDKIDFARKLGTLKIFRPYANLGNKIKYKSIQPLLNALANPIRISILEILSNESLRYSQILTNLGFKPSKDGGRFGYHLRLLLNNRLIVENRNKKYEITEKGLKILEILRKLEKIV
ncbi:MAG: hypothetical protein DRH17_13430 [Deltaproteobacteria bacterium]|nr:MAG: hypothetical protein DRH17_13430 [Deltaproteobacteria bacterium]